MFVWLHFCGGAFVARSVRQESCKQVLEKIRKLKESVVEECCRKVLEKIVVKMCGREVLKKSVVEKWEEC